MFNCVSFLDNPTIKSPIQKLFCVKVNSLSIWPSVLFLVQALKKTKTKTESNENLTISLRTFYGSWYRLKVTSLLVIALSSDIGIYQYWNSAVHYFNCFIQLCYCWSCLYQDFRCYETKHVNGFPFFIAAKRKLTQVLFLLLSIRFLDN